MIRDFEIWIMSLLGDIFKCSQIPQTPLEEIKSELHRYKLEEPLDLESYPLKWWLQRHTTYPHISKFLQGVWSLVATSVPSERVFSVAGNVINEKEVVSCQKMLINLYSCLKIM